MNCTLVWFLVNHAPTNSISVLNTWASNRSACNQFLELSCLTIKNSQIMIFLYWSELFLFYFIFFTFSIFWVWFFTFHSVVGNWICMVEVFHEGIWILIFSLNDFNKIKFYNFCLYWSSLRIDLSLFICEFEVIRYKIVISDP